MSEGQFVRLAPRAGAEIRFTLDGRPAAARPGDTVLTAILLNRTTVGGHEFLAHDRAGFCLMGACQACWVYDADGRRRRGCSTLVEPDMALYTTWTPAHG
jgi:predicted molibdopterin-dependent oxidoreductase YjgC